MYLEIVSPEATLFSGEVTSIAVPGVNGEFEMLWRPLKLGVTHISPGQSGQAIALLDEKLARFQGRESLATHPFIYSKDLSKISKRQKLHKL